MDDFENNPVDYLDLSDAFDYLDMGDEIEDNLMFLMEQGWRDMKNEQTFNFDHLNNIYDENKRQDYRNAVINSFIQPLELIQERRMLEIKKLVIEMLVDFQKEKEFLKQCIDELEEYIANEGYYGVCASYEYEDFLIALKIYYKEIYFDFPETVLVSIKNADLNISQSKPWDI